MYFFESVHWRVFMMASLTIWAGILMPGTSIASGPPSFEAALRSMLKSAGEPADTPEDLAAARHSRSPSVRQFALLTLGEQQGKLAVPVIKEYLNDQDIDVRTTAAGLLASFGDHAGLERMRADFQSLFPPGRTPEEPGDPREIGLHQLQPALRTGRVLAELDDHRALTLALRALEHPLPVVRSYAVSTLGAIGRDGAEQKSGRLAVEAMIRLTGTEENRNVQVSMSTAARKMEPRAAVRVFDALSESERVPDWLRAYSARNRELKEQELRAAATRPAADSP